MFETFIATRSSGGKHATVFLQDNLDSDDVVALDELLTALFDQHIWEVAIDFSKISRISSAIAGVLVWAQTKARERGGEITLLNVTESVLEVLELLGVLKTFNLSLANSDPSSTSSRTFNKLMDSMSKIE